jgi:hypothetical protein
MRYGSIIRTSFIVGLLVSSTAPSWAGKFAQEHPRRAEVLHRDNQLQKQTNNDKGHLEGHYGQISREDNSIRRQEQNDSRINGGYITKGQQNHLNQEENGVQRQIDRDSSGSSFSQQHPRRAEVLGRDNGLNNQINNDKGHLDGQYGRLQGEDQSIRRQEQTDARNDGGHITAQEQQHLNGEENRLQRQVNNDNSGYHTGGVVGRDAGLNNQINNDKGHLAGHYGQLSHEDQGIQNQYMADRMKDGGGNLTYGQRNQLNGEENHLQRQVDRDSSVGGFAQQHPRRAEVLGRDNGLNNQISNDKGHLDGQYGALKQDDQSIRGQEQADARANGGYITTGQQQHLNREENQLQRQINKDNQ